MHWCSPSEEGSFFDFSPQPSVCFVQTVPLFVGNIFFSLVLFTRITLLRHQVTFDLVVPSALRGVQIVRVLALIIVLLTVILAFNVHLSIAQLTYTGSSIIMWWLFAVAGEVEALRLEKWPSVVLLTVVALSLMMHALFASVLFRDYDSIAVDVITALLVSFILVVLVFMLLKDQLLKGDGEEELQRYSIEFTNGPAIRRWDNNPNNHSESFCSRVMNPFSSSSSSSYHPVDHDNNDTRASGTSTVHMHKLDMSHSEKSMSSFWPWSQSNYRQSQNSRAGDFQSLLDEGLLDGEDEHNERHSSISQGSHSTYSAGRKSYTSRLHSTGSSGGSGGGGGVGGMLSSMVSSSSNHPASSGMESAIDKNLRAATATHDNSKKGSNTMFSSARWTSRNNSHEPPRDSQHSANDENNNELSTGSTGSGRLGRAVSAVMEQHRAKLSASSPLLEPRGHHRIEDTGPLSSATSGNNNGIGSLQGGGNQRFSQALSPPSKGKLRPLRVSVQRWGYRARRGGGGNGSGPTTPATGRSGGMQSTSAMETEFEIISALMTNNNGPSPANGRWTVWRSVGEVYKLHTNMVSLLGDFAPRRPQFKADRPASSKDLHAQQHEAEEPSEADLAADMRALAVYLSALLRVDYSHGIHLPALLEFLHIPREAVDPSAAPPSTKEGLNMSVLGENGRESSVMDEDRGGYILSIAPPLPPTVMTTAGTDASEPSPANNNNKLSPGRGPQSLMDAAQQAQAAQQEHQQEKWRKLFFHLRIKLKPHDIAVRCRLFEGVISGGEVAGFLLHSQSNTLAFPNGPGGSNVSPVGSISGGEYEVARDRFEACKIGQELLSCGLLLPVCVGFTGDDRLLGLDHDHDDEEDEVAAVNIPPSINDEASAAGGESKVETPREKSGASNNLPLSSISRDQSTTAFEMQPVFSDLPGFIFRFPVKSGTAGRWSLFGAFAQVKIPLMTLADESDLQRTARETMGFMINNELGTLADLDAADAVTPSAAASSGGSGSFVVYLIEISHGGDTWQTTRRYREFEQLHRNLTKEGIRPDGVLPAKSLVPGLVRVARPQFDESRRSGLETYLSSVVQAVIDVGEPKAMMILAQFLDDEYNALRIMQS